MRRPIGKPELAPNDGARRMRVLRRRKSQRQIAAKVGRVPRCVGYWEDGTRKPESDIRGELATHFGIPPESWDLPNALHTVP